MFRIWRRPGMGSKSLPSRPRRRTTAHRQPHFRPQLVPLEDRIALANVTADIAISRYPDGHQIDVFNISDGGIVRTNRWSDSSGWGTAYAVPGISQAGSVAAISRYPDGHQIDIFTTEPFSGSSGAVRGNWWSDYDGKWHTEYAVPGLNSYGGNVAAISRYPDGHQIDLFTTDSSGTVWGDYWRDSTGWATAYAVPSLHSAPGARVTALSRYPDGHQIDLFTTDSSGTVWGDYWRDSTGWATAYAVPSLHSAPGAQVTALSRYPDGHQIDLFTTDSSGTVWGDYWRDSTGWATAYAVPSLHSAPGAQVTALSRYPDGHQIDLFTTDSSGTVWGDYWRDSTGWATAYAVPSLHSAPGARVTALSRYPDGHQIDLFTRDSSGTVRGDYWRDSTGWATAYTVPGLWVLA